MATKLPEAPRVGMVSLGCPKNLVDSELILTKLRSDGYAMSPDYAGADVVLVATGRRPNTGDLGLETAGITPDMGGFIPVDARGRTDGCFF